MTESAPKLDLVDILALLDRGEDTSLEAKEAAGKSGEGSLPKSFFETYSAMANTNGGIILLGVKEKPKGTFLISGIEKTGPVIKQIWDELHDRDKTSCNLLGNEMIRCLQVETKTIVAVSIPRARRTERPVYINKNPLTGTFRRNYEGDYRCDESTVKRMLSEQLDPSLDSRIVKGFSREDLESATIDSYRNQLRSSNPQHPWLSLQEGEFLRCLGAIGANRETREEGVTLAGLLMFGKLRSILDAVPNFVLDYQERPGPLSEIRWIDRITTDFTWSGNLFDFFWLSIRKLSEGIKIPFRLEGIQRTMETPVHEALREALVNTLIHADYNCSASVLIVKRPDMFEFRNPGTMRISVEDAIIGGTSDCRNRNLQKMFQLIGLGEQAGSGLSKIWRNWQQQQWRAPSLYERTEPDETRLELHMLSILPPEIVRELQHRFGENLSKFTDAQRLALSTACLESAVTHRRLKDISSEHSRDLTLALAGLVRDGIFERRGSGKGTYYFFAGEEPFRSGEPSDLDQPGLNSVPSSTLSSVPSAQDRRDLTLNSVPFSTFNSVPLSESNPDPSGRSVPLPKNRRFSKDELRNQIMRICQRDFVSLRDLAAALGKKPDYLRIKHLTEMVDKGLLQMQFPNAVNHPNQAYRTRQE